MPTLIDFINDMSEIERQNFAALLWAGKVETVDLKKVYGEDNQSPPANAFIEFITQNPLKILAGGGEGEKRAGGEKSIQYKVGDEEVLKLDNRTAMVDSGKIEFAQVIKEAQEKLPGVIPPVNSVSLSKGEDGMVNTFNVSSFYQKGSLEQFCEELHKNKPSEPVVIFNKVGPLLQQIAKINTEMAATDLKLSNFMINDEHELVMIDLKSLKEKSSDGVCDLFLFEGQLTPKCSPLYGQFVDMDKFQAYVLGRNIHQALTNISPMESQGFLSRNVGRKQINKAGIYKNLPLGPLYQKLAIALTEKDEVKRMSCKEAEMILTALVDNNTEIANNVFANRTGFNESYKQDIEPVNNNVAVSIDKLSTEQQSAFELRQVKILSAFDMSETKISPDEFQKVKTQLTDLNTEITEFKKHYDEKITPVNEKVKENIKLLNPEQKVRFNTRREKLLSALSSGDLTFGELETELTQLNTDITEFQKRYDKEITPLKELFEASIELLSTQKKQAFELKYSEILNSLGRGEVVDELFQVVNTGLKELFDEIKGSIKEHLVSSLNEANSSLSKPTDLGLSQSDKNETELKGLLKETLKKLGEESKEYASEYEKLGKLLNASEPNSDSYDQITQGLNVMSHVKSSSSSRVH